MDAPQGASGSLPHRRLRQAWGGFVASQQRFCAPGFQSLPVIRQFSIKITTSQFFVSFFKKTVAQISGVAYYSSRKA
jgi:hypothetical protein